QPSFSATWDFTLAAPAEVWERFFQPVPPPNYHSVFAMLARVPTFHIEGDRLAFVQHAHLVRRLLELLRETLNGAPETPSISPASAPGTIEPIVGRYMHVRVDDTSYRIYFEEAGT